MQKLITSYASLSVSYRFIPKQLLSSLVSGFAVLMGAMRGVGGGYLIVFLSIFLDIFFCVRFLLGWCCSSFFLAAAQGVQNNIFVLLNSLLLLHWRPRSLSLLRRADRLAPIWTEVLWACNREQSSLCPSAWPGPTQRQP